MDSEPDNTDNAMPEPRIVSSFSQALELADEYRDKGFRCKIESVEPHNFMSHWRVSPHL